MRLEKSNWFIFSWML